MQQKYIFGKHCKVSEKKSLLEAFLSHHYRFLVERQVQQDSGVEQRAGEQYQQNWRVSRIMLQSVVDQGTDSI